MDKIVSAVYFEGELFVFTEQGNVFRITKSGLTGEVRISSVGKLF